ncbi:MAG: DHH family phosphoesterase [Eubacteriaceae bacterium]|jgi:phosphoesterase RecJ-like protein
MKIPEKIGEIINGGQSFLLLAHTHPDGDAVGSVTALGRGLKSLGKQVDYFMDPEIEEKLGFIKEIGQFKHKASELKPAYDAVIYLDCSTQDYAFAPDPFPKCAETIVVDHHKSNEGYGDVNYVETTGATGELVYLLLEELGADVDEESKEALFAALSSDTGSFQFSNTTPQTHQIAAALHEGGKTFSPISKCLHTEKTFNQMKLYGEAVHALELLDNEQIAFYALPYNVIQKYGGNLNITDDVANIGMNIRPVILSASAKESEPGVWRISLRSKSPYPLDVSDIAVGYGGGGHMRAAGCSFEGTETDLRKDLIPKLEELLQTLPQEDHLES